MDHAELQKKINEELGADSVGSLVPIGKGRVRDGLSTGSLSLNKALSGNPLVGFAWGKTVEIYGPEQAGKTTLCLHCISELQKLEHASGRPLPALFVDAEHALDLEYASNLVDLGNLSIAQPDSGEKALETVRIAVANGYKLVVVDSVAALTPMDELSARITDQQVGLQARMISKAMRVLCGVVAKQNAIVIFTNQIRMKIGVMFSNPETTPGGMALKFFTSYRLELRSPRGGAKTEKSITGATEESGKYVNVKVVKNKVYPPYRSASFFVRYGIGIDKEQDIVDYLKNRGDFDGSSKVQLDTGKSYGAPGLLRAMRESEDVRESAVRYLISDDSV